MAEGAGEARGAERMHDGFRGAAGRTRSVTSTIWCAGCGTWFGGRWWAALDASTDQGRIEALLEHGFGGINRNHCPSCSASYVVQEPLVVHRPAEAQLLLVVPNRRMHRAQHARAALITAVADDPGSVAPAYAREPMLVAGVSGLRGLIGEVTRVSGRPASVPPASARPAEPVALSDESPSAVASADVASARAAESSDAPVTVPAIDLEDETGSIGNRTVEVESLEDEPAARPTEGEASIGADSAADPEPAGMLAALMADGDATQVPEEDRTGPWHDAWSLEGTGHPVEHEPTRVSRMVAPRARLPEGSTTRLVLDDGDVIGLFRVPSAAEADGLLADGAELRFQLHSTPHGPAMCLTLVPTDPEGVVCWVIDPEAGADILELLQRRFTVALEAVDGEGALVARRVFSPPLARNVARARAHVLRAGGSPAAALEAVATGAIDRLGQLRHNFTEHAFAASRSVADAHLALGIVGFWAEPERQAYLFGVQSFPVVWFEAIERRVLSAGLDCGLMPPPHLEERAIELGFAGDDRSLLSRALGAFAELNLSTSIKANDLDPIDNYENWERLLTRAESLGLAVDAGLRGLALSAMEAARRASDVLDASEAAIELDPDEDVIELESVDEIFDSSVGAADDAETTEPLTDLIDGALVGLLADPRRRASSAAVLLQRGQLEYGAVLADALAQMGAEELIQVLPLGLARVDALAIHLGPVLRSADAVVRRAITLFLAEGRRPEAILILVDQLLDARDAGWVPLAMALAGYGADVRHLVAGMPLDGDGLERVARVLAAMPTGLREAVYDAGARRSTRVQLCLERAQRLARDAVSPPPFAARLESALSMLAVGDTSGPIRGVPGGGDGGPRFR